MREMEGGKEIERKGDERDRDTERESDTNTDRR